MHMAIEAVQQLRGEARGQQVQDARNARCCTSTEAPTRRTPPDPEQREA